MLFSHPLLAERITRDFEPVWVKLREAPQVTIDFGGGPARIVRRTLHGNIATWVLDAQGRALDVIPGIYTPEAYAKRLDAAIPLHKSALLAATDLRAYHARQAEGIAAGKPPMLLVKDGMAKAAIEMWTLRAVEDLSPERLLAQPGVREALQPVPDASKRRLERPVEDAASRVRRDHLEEDVRLNETVRRLAVHKILAETGPVPLDDALTKRVYREVLHCDLDDPYLGLGEMLFRDYPFEK